MADIKLESFKNQLKDGCRPNRFAFNITNGAALGNQGAAWEEKLSFFTKTFSIPAREIGEIVVNYQGLQTKIAGDTTFADLTVTLHNSYDWSARDFFEQWQEGIVLVEDEGTNTRTAPAEYKSTLEVEQLGRDGETIATYVIVGAWPKSVEAIELSHESTDTLEEVSVTFSYDTWYQKA